MTHPGIDAIVQLIAASGLNTASIPEQREMMAGVADSPPPAGTTATPEVLGGRPCEWVVTEGGGRDRVLLYFHGGGYCIGSVATHRGLAGALALASGIAVVTLDYRLGPEDPFPAAVDDGLAAYRELLDRGIEPGRIAIGGDSAGGGLTVATMLAARNAGLPQPAAGICLSPWADLRQCADSYDRLAELDPMVTRAGLDEMAGFYLGGTDPSHPLASPLLADLTGLPPLRVEVGEHEILLDDAIGLVDAAAAAGVEAELIRWPELVHVFQAFPAEMVPEAAESVAGLGAFLRSHLA